MFLEEPALSGRLPVMSSYRCLRRVTSRAATVSRLSTWSPRC